MDYGAFYEVASAKYCPRCKKMQEVITEQNFAIYSQERFLPVMKKKLIENPELRRELKKEDKGCPRCGSSTYTFYKDLGAIDYYDNYWTVCTNPDCDWSGMHRETYEQGPY